MEMDVMVIDVYIPAVPVAQPRAKATSINGAARMYTPTKMASGKTHPIAAFKAAVAGILADVFAQTARRASDL